MIRADVAASIYAQVVQGVAKAECHLVTDKETSAYFDRVAVEVAQMRGKGFTFEVPSTPTYDPEEMGLTVEDVLRLQREWPERRAKKTSGTTPETDEADDPEPGVEGRVREEAMFYLIQDPGDAQPYALVEAEGGVYNWWTEEGWVDTPYFASYFVGGDPGAREITPEEAEEWKGKIKLPEASAVEMLRAKA